MILIQKPGKSLEEPSSYRLISLLSTASKLFEKLYAKRLHDIVNSSRILPDHQFGFRGKHATIEQVYRVVRTAQTTLEMKQFCPTVFPDVSEAFNRKWKDALLHKVSNHVLYKHTHLLESYLGNRCFQVRYGEANSTVKQGSALGPFLYLVYTADIPTPSNVITATFADDTSILSPRDDYATAVHNL